MRTASQLINAVFPLATAAGIAMLSGTCARADTVDDLVTFSAGTTARADEVNGNFSEVADAVNGNDAWIAALEAEIVDLRNALEAANGCPAPDPSDEMVKVGGVCIDKYEASIWDAPVGGSQIIGTSTEDYCNPNGQDCDDIYARSVAGVEPARFVTWFQAQRALANAGKRLPSNAEWQMAVAGTPDPGDTPGPEDCNTMSAGPVDTGSRPGCVSAFGAFDMVGNVWEWVADWDEVAGDCQNWPASLGDDLTCMGRADGVDIPFPAPLRRGGDWNDGASAGRFAVEANILPQQSFPDYGFRGVR